MATYLYKCKTCDKKFESDKLYRSDQCVHFKEDGRTAVSDICGEVVRDYLAEGVAVARVPGGARG
jgi:hypothetical protein